MRRARIGDLKLHLRSEKDGTGVLVINASAALFLDRVAMSYLDAFMAESEKLKDSEWLEDPLNAGRLLFPGIASRIRRRFRVHKKTAEADWTRLWQTVLAVATGESCPFSDYEVRRVEPLSVDLSAPYRCDLIVTYRCQNNCSHCYAGGPHKTCELEAEHWKEIIEKLALWGVPTLVFTGGEPLLREDLEEMIGAAEDSGCVTGLITNGRLLTEPRVERLFRAGLDFVQVTLESSDEDIHDGMVGAKGAWKETVSGIKNAAGRIFTTTNTTVTPENLGTVMSTVALLKDLGVKKFGINALIRAGRGTSQEGISRPELESTLKEVSRLSQDMDFPLIWYTPTCYQDLDPVALGLGVKTCSAASTVMAIEPDGNAMPCQSYYRSIGNALEDNMESIWNHPLAKSLRHRRADLPAHPDFPVLPEKCRGCAQLPLCGGACPLDRRKSC